MNIVKHENHNDCNHNFAIAMVIFHHQLESGCANRKCSTLIQDRRCAHNIQQFETNNWIDFLFRMIVDRIDENKDAFVDMAELKNWISFTQRRYIEDDVNRQWKQHNPDNADKLHWEVILCCVKIYRIYVGTQKLLRCWP